MKKEKNEDKKSPETRKIKNLMLKPTFGRDYKNPEDLLNDWDAGKDFEIENSDFEYLGFYINKTQFYDRDEFDEVKYIHFKYDNLSKRHVIKPAETADEY